MSSREHLWQSIRDALSPANYNPKQLSDYRKELIVRTSCTELPEVTAAPKTRKRS